MAVTVCALKSLAPNVMSFDASDAAIRVLCVDDEPNILNALRRMLVLADFEIEIAESGEKALEVQTTASKVCCRLRYANAEHERRSTAGNHQRKIP